MSEVVVHKVNDVEKPTLPIFGEIATRFGAIERRAFELFEKRGGGSGRELEDWLRAEYELGSPAAELSEKEGAYEMLVALPGFEAKDVEVTAAPSGILVHAATNVGPRAQRDPMPWIQFCSNDVYKHFEFSNPIEVGKVTGNFENGLLCIKAPEIARTFI
jgi:HSP20 family molecular chaperone IbpA